ncbi:MAG TPA: hypothetical protein VGF04_11170 [Solirubrobacterales bacterium]|jgi:hypothetical protein
MQERRKLRDRLTYSNVLSTICLFLLLGGGGAFAASHLRKGSVGTKQLKKNAVTKAKIRKNAVTTAKIKAGAVTGSKIANGSIKGGDIDLATLGTVPNAVAANGQTPTKIFKTFNDGEGGIVATIAGFTMAATCNGESDVDVTLSSPASAHSVEIAEGFGQPEGRIFEYESTSAGTSAQIRLDGKAGDNDFGETTFTAATSTGTVLSGDIAFDFKTFDGNPPDTCGVFGEVLSG